MELVTGTKWSGVNYGTTTRDMKGVSVAPFDCFNLGLHCGDNPEHAQANRHVLEATLPSRPIWLNQVHGIAVLDADSTFEYPPQADAALTMQQGRVLAIMTADCLPVVIADDAGTIVGAAHAGWRGLQAGVLENLVDKMRQKVPDARLKAWIGPAISQPVFEVGGEVYAAFVQATPALKTFFIAYGEEVDWSKTRFVHLLHALHKNNDKVSDTLSHNHSFSPQFKQPAKGKYLADLAGIAEYKLRQKGLNEVIQSNQCTYLQKDKYFSYRRENPTGRIVTLAWLGEHLT
ncbi:peptidoglycan editing factor PgeF [Pelistega europaea]|uniref:Purine nucleoside phosphorylase n=1 Tax=Pelistega europaea TaxID=106147 RepID=A0A7Y4P5Y9_9BURK|nr:peptidoglycan editing factor PgeF [Pelistega europaea]NOL49364.1 peptidoglycan editing factor PgeF [Pelistega europaea]